MNKNIHKHPCFNKEMANKSARIHLPLIKSCNIQCNYCNRKYSCPNENRPGVSNKIIKPEEVYKIIENSLKKYNNLNIVGVAGPGEALTAPDVIFKAFISVRKNFPELKLCLSTNGYALLDSIELIKDLNIEYITVTLNTINPNTAALIYKDINPEEFIFKQINGLKELIKLNTVVKINTVAIPNINYGKNLPDIVEVAKLAESFGIFVQNIMPFIPVEGSFFEDLREPKQEEIENLRKICSTYIKQMSHCKRCRADAEGFL